MNRRSLLAAAAALAGAPALGQAAPARRNVLLIIADDQGLDLGLYGGLVKTPNLDALGRRGTTFAQAFATVSSCSPSRSVLYTGLYSHTNGMYGLAHDVHNQSLLDGVVTLPARLKAAGYATALVGKKHVRPDAAFPYDAELAPEQPGNRDVAFMAKEAGRFMRGAGDRPFFVTVGYSDPHRAAENFGNTRTWPEVPRVTYDPVTIAVPVHLPDTPEVRADLAQYGESVSRLDAGVGLLLRELEAAGAADSTLVIYLSDNGRPFPGAKTNLYDEGLHLPLIIAAPGRRAGVRSQAMVSWIDIAPTILEHAGVAAELPGRSLLPILETPDPTGWDRVFASHGFHEINQYYPMRLMRTRTHAFIQNLAHPLDYPIAGDVAASPSWRAVQETGRLGARPLQAYLRRPAEELYDLTRDPRQLVNLAGRPEAKPLQDRLRTDLTAWRTQTRDPWLAGQTNAFGPSHAH